MWALIALVLLPAVGSPLDAGQIRALGESDDVFHTPRLEQVFDDGLEKLKGFPDPLFPFDLEEETIAALQALFRLDRASSALRATRALKFTSSSRLAWAAREILARDGDLETIRRALLRYFEDEERWGAVLSQSDDPRLVDFRREDAREPALTQAHFLSTLEWNLSRARERAPVRALVHWAETSTEIESPRRVLEALERGTPYDARIARWLARNGREETSAPPPGLDFDADLLRIHDAVLGLPPRDRLRAIEILAKEDHPALAGLPMSGADIDRLYPYLARSSRRAVRERVTRSVRERGRALASLVLSQTAAPDEKRAVLDAMREARSEALAVPASAVPEVMLSLVGESAMRTFIAETEACDALAALPLPEARRRLESLASQEAIERLMERSDRIAALPFLERTRRSFDRNVARAAELALLSLGAPGSSAFLRRELARGEIRDDLLAPILSAPLDPSLGLEVLGGPAAKAPPSPAGFAALASYQERYPDLFFSWSSGLSERDAWLQERAHFVLSFAREPRRVPLLVDLAVGGAKTSLASREAAFTALAESDLGVYGARLHRLAGDPDRAVRFRAAAALVPSGEPWTLRLLLGELDPRSALERRIAQRAVYRLPPERARALLEEMVSDQTARSFGVLLFLDLVEADLGRELRAQLWAIVGDDAEAGNETALLAASRIQTPEAIAGVVRFLTAQRSAW